MPQISVIIAVLNEDKYLKGCLESLTKQTGVTFEAIIIDDGSYRPVDLEKLEINDKRFSVHRLNHSGTAKARNYGVSQAKGDILVFLDGDMTFEPEFLKDLTKPIRDGKAKGTFSVNEFVANWDNVWARCWNYENGLLDNKRIAQKRKDQVRDFRAISKTEFEQVKGFEDIGYTDTWTLSEKLGYIPVATEAVYYHYNPSSLHEVFRQALWIGGRKRRLGVIGKLFAVFRSLVPFSVLIGVFKALSYHEPHYLKFKLIYDLGIFGGAVGSLKK